MVQSFEAGRTAPGVPMRSDPSSDPSTSITCYKDAYSASGQPLDQRHIIVEEDEQFLLELGPRGQIDITVVGTPFTLRLSEGVSKAIIFAAYERICEIESFEEIHQTLKEKDPTWAQEEDQLRVVDYAEELCCRVGCINDAKPGYHYCAEHLVAAEKDIMADAPYTDEDLREQAQIAREWNVYRTEGDESPPYKFEAEQARRLMQERYHDYSG